MSRQYLGHNVNEQSLRNENFGRRSHFIRDGSDRPARGVLAPSSSERAYCGTTFQSPTAARHSGGARGICANQGAVRARSLEYPFTIGLRARTTDGLSLSLNDGPLC